MGNVLEKLIEPLEERFTWHDAIVEAAAKRDMLEAFAYYADEQLAAAAREIRRTRLYPNMPQVGEVAEVLKKITGGRANPAEHRAYPSHPEITPEAYAAADELVRCELGERAAREGWLLGLHDHCRRHRRHPSAGEQAKMINAAREMDAWAAGRRIPPPSAPEGGGCIDGVSLRVVMDAARSFIVRRRQLERRLFGKDEAA